MCWTDGIAKSTGEYNVFYTSDIEGMSKFILDVNFNMQGGSIAKELHSVGVVSQGVPASESQWWAEVERKDLFWTA